MTSMLGVPGRPRSCTIALFFGSDADRTTTMRSAKPTAENRSSENSPLGTLRETPSTSQHGVECQPEHEQDGAAQVDFPAIAMANDGRYLVAGIEKPGGTSHAVVDVFRFPVERMGNLLDRRTSGVALDLPKVAIGQGGRSWVVAWQELRASGIAIVIVRGKL